MKMPPQKSVLGEFHEMPPSSLLVISHFCIQVYCSIFRRAVSKTAHKSRQFRGHFIKPVGGGISLM